MENIPAVANNKTNVNSAEFVKLTVYNDVNITQAINIVSGTQYEIKTIGSTPWTTIGAPSSAIGTTFTANAAGSGSGTAYDVSVYTFSSAYKAETIANTVYSPLGGLLAVGIQQRDIRVTSADTTIMLSGIPADGSDNMAVVLGTKIRGSKLQVTRGFYNNNYVLANTAARFTGIITSYNVTEERQDLVDNFVITVNASSYKTVLENKISGRKTNPESWKVYNPSDTSMDNVYSLADQYFDFGVKPKQGAATEGTATTTVTNANQNDNSGT
jgi:hypothetical protein